MADAGRSRARRGRLVRYTWTLNGTRLKACRARRCAFRARRGTVQSLVLTVADARGVKDAARRRFAVRR